MRGRRVDFMDTFDSFHAMKSDQSEFGVSGRWLVVLVHVRL